jgi:hypothetical protein
VLRSRRRNYESEAGKPIQIPNADPNSTNIDLQKKKKQKKTKKKTSKVFEQAGER